jgi:hypothetical protein
MATQKLAEKAKSSSLAPKPKKEAVKIDNSLEAKAKRFKTIAGRRTKKIIVTLQNLGNTSNRNVYGYDEAQVNYIFENIEKQLKLTKEKFASKAAEKKLEFDLDAAK